MSHVDRQKSREGYSLHSWTSGPKGVVLGPVSILAFFVRRFLIANSMFSAIQISIYSGCFFKFTLSLKHIRFIYTATANSCCIYFSCFTVLRIFMTGRHSSIHYYILARTKSLPWNPFLELT